MLAYLFWHRRAASTDRGEYEARLRAFHQALGDAVSASAAYRLERLPFAESDGYEDWYLVEDWARLGELNAAAVDETRGPPHDGVASRAAEGWGGVYALLAGDPRPPAGARWQAKRRGESYEAFIESQRAPGVWQRQMVLGPAPEFCLAQERTPGRERVWP